MLGKIVKRISVTPFTLKLVARIVTKQEFMDKFAQKEYLEILGTLI